MAKDKPGYVLALTAFAAVVLLGIIVILGGFYNHNQLPGMPAAAAGTAPSSHVTVTATGSAIALPSQVHMYLYANSSAPAAQVATQGLAATIGEINSTLLPYIGRNLSNIQTVSYSLYKVYNRSAYTATEGLSITIPNIGNASAAIGALSSISNVYVNGVNAQLSAAQISSLRDQALSSALANATSQASILANNATVQLGNVTVNSYGIIPFYGNSFMPTIAAAATTQSGPGFYGGVSTVTESITATFYPQQVYFGK